MWLDALIRPSRLRVLACGQLPKESGQKSLPRLSIASLRSSVSGLIPLTLSVKTECDRDDRSFMSVAATARRDRALSSSVATERGLLSGTTQSIFILASITRAKELTADGVGDGHLALFVNFDLVLLRVELPRTQQIIDLLFSITSLNQPERQNLRPRCRLRGIGPPSDTSTLDHGAAS